jgi:hypothetical protein
MNVTSMAMGVDMRVAGVAVIMRMGMVSHGTYSTRGRVAVQPFRGRMS